MKITPLLMLALSFALVGANCSEFAEIEIDSQGLLMQGAWAGQVLDRNSQKLYSFEVFFTSSIKDTSMIELTGTAIIEGANLTLRGNEQMPFNTTCIASQSRCVTRWGNGTRLKFDLFDDANVKRYTFESTRTFLGQGQSDYKRMFGNVVDYKLAGFRFFELAQPLK
jgi:hypothetical protein